ncbi:hypothetical protein SDRG_04368 [Saprolegnia diclina VS20]|uniref:WW domain-containing protein n=1 Tax=Saprolegnia diclina (strain VS20) TaxID=1156394 RepID=T0S7H8_SAPDV|nr:hypothetical protein SDRG_04368 [Saprolegnia diclina VS20]EQC38672.1 hypothetical protein SDRG_04368 [Saprolegnia diclina VS20]|eukprot:XP_008608264.1 hypothetical protein SDRG_04368 [Saprolegnia diclina VS20]
MPAEAIVACRTCRAACPPTFKFCDQCGARLVVRKAKSKTSKKKRATPTAPEVPTAETGWFWGATATLPRLVHAKPAPEPPTNQETCVKVRALAAKVTATPTKTRPPEGPSTAPPLLWGTCFAKAQAEYRATEALLVAEIAADTKIIAHMAAQAQAHAFKNDETFRFACRTKRELERKVHEHSASLARVRRDLAALAANEDNLSVVQKTIGAQRAAETQLWASRDADARRVQRWWRHAHARRVQQHRTSIRIYRGYLHYRYTARVHQIFGCTLYFRLDRADKARKARLEVVAFATQFQSPFDFHFQFENPHAVVAAARRLQRYVRHRRTRHGFWQLLLQRARLLVLAARTQAEAAARHDAVVRIQAAMRRKQARRHVVRRIALRYEKCMDATTLQPFYVDRVAGVSSWTKPRVLYERDLEVVANGTTMAREHIDAWLRLETPRRQRIAAEKIQARVRAFLARRRLQALVASMYEKHVDPSSGASFYYNTATGATSWTRPKLLAIEILDGPLAVAAPTDVVRDTPAPEFAGKSPKKSQALYAVATPRRRELAAQTLQCFVRVCAAKAQRMARTAAIYIKCVDDETQRCFYFNRATGVSQWTKPLGLGATDLPTTRRGASPRPTTTKARYEGLDTPRRRVVAATTIQARYRTKRARDGLRQLLAKAIRKCYDTDSRQYFYYNEKSGLSSWSKPRLLVNDVKAALARLPTPRRRDAAATKLQSMYRTRVARTRLRTMIAATYQRHLDADSQTYYYYNTMTGQSQWTKPRGLGASELGPIGSGHMDALRTLPTPRRHDVAAMRIQGMYRCHVARAAAAAAAHDVYEACVDADSGAPYYFNRRSGVSSWTRPRWLVL